MNRLTRFAALAAVGFSVFAAPMVMAEDEVDAATKDKITAQLTAEGYEIRKIEREDGMIEVYAVKDGQTVQLFLDADLKVVEMSDQG